jgi:hypothetical protein
LDPAALDPAPEGPGFSALAEGSAAGSSTAPEGPGFSALAGGSAAGSSRAPSPEDTAVLDAERTMRFPTRPAPRQKSDGGSSDEATAVIELAPPKKDGEKSDES